MKFVLIIRSAISVENERLFIIDIRPSHAFFFRLLSHPSGRTRNHRLPGLIYSKTAQRYQSKVKLATD